MPNLTLKQLPETLYRNLKRRAKQNNRSLNKEIIASLEKTVASQPLIEVEDFISKARAMRTRVKGRLTDQLLKSMRDSGRE